MAESASHRIADAPRLSMVALGVVAGLAALWVYTAAQQSRADRDAQHGAEGGRGQLRRTRTIRRQRRPDAIASEIRLDEHIEPPPMLPARPSEANSSTSDSEDSSSVSMKLLHLLCTISEQHAQANGIAHRGTACNACQETPIRGARYKCAQCANLDLCAACEAHGLHAHHVLLKISVPLPPLTNSRTPLLRQPYAGQPRAMPRDVGRRLEELTSLDRKDLASLYAQFSVLATRQGDQEVMTREAFDRCLGQFGGPRSVLASRLFAFYDTAQQGFLTFDQVAAGFSAYTRGTVDDKAPRVLRAYDVDGDGRVGREDVRVMLEAFADANRELTRNVVRAMEQDIVEQPERLLPGQPVSAAFTAPMPQDTQTALDKEVGALRAEVLALRESSAARRAAVMPVYAAEPSDEGVSEGAESLVATTAATAGSSRLPRRESESHVDAVSVAGHSADTNVVPRQGLSPDALVPAPTFWHDRSEDDDWPVMEALSQDAIRIMVDDIFDEAAPKDPAYMTADEFSAYLHLNPSLALYLEMLGPIF
ncbi:hypothetical protein LPJ73_000438 [Coemansia sp. RSA 2703]|nr:hypothetical protein LPJ73_000438 [Coemansia sp. RSA 2703]KAJ2375672.1 hypothetical protein IW150_002416 [Coemansia sp. RSA 2607]KAJ2397073.1 hypothetical protein GGI05_000824 [Coemansia sp. RSA 2603]